MSEILTGAATTLVGLVLGYAIGYQDGKRNAALLLEQRGVSRDLINRALGWWKT